LADILATIAALAGRGLFDSIVFFLVVYTFSQIVSANAFRRIILYRKKLKNKKYGKYFLYFSWNITDIYRFGCNAVAGKQETYEFTICIRVAKFGFHPPGIVCHNSSGNRND